MDIEQTIDRVEKLYSAVTGARPPQMTNGPHAPIPPETDPVRHVENQLVRLLASLERLSQTVSSSTQPPPWSPRLCAWETEQSFEIAVEVPGVSREEIEVSVDERLLTIRGSRRMPWGDRQPRGFESEMPFGPFIRTLTLPVRAEQDKVAVQLRDGVLAIRVPRAPRDESTRTIPIK
jgi:HSP20 family protein